MDQDFDGPPNEDPLVDDFDIPPNDDPPGAGTRPIPRGVLPLQLARSITLQQMFNLPRITANGPHDRTSITSRTATTIAKAAPPLPASAPVKATPMTSVIAPVPPVSASIQASRDTPRVGQIPEDLPQDTAKERRRATSYGFEIIPASTNNLRKAEAPVPQSPPFDMFSFPPRRPISVEPPFDDHTSRQPLSDFHFPPTAPRPNSPPSLSSPPSSPAEPAYPHTPRLRRRRSSIFPPPDEDRVRSRAASLAPVPQPKRGRSRTPKAPTKTYMTRARSAGPLASRPPGETRRDPVVERYQKEVAREEFGLRKRSRGEVDGSPYLFRRTRARAMSFGGVRD